MKYSLKGTAYSFHTNMIRKVDGPWRDSPEESIRSLVEDFLKKGQMNDLLVSYYLTRKADRYEEGAQEVSKGVFFVKVEVENLREVLTTSGFRLRTPT